MNYYEEATKQTLKDLGITKPYRGSEYIASSINYISSHENCFTPITKILYPEIAKIHHTSREGVECGIREIIELIWINNSNVQLRNVIFPRYKTEKPTNSEFLFILYQFLSHGMKHHDFTYICPTTGTYCKHSREIIAILLLS